MLLSTNYCRTDLSIFAVTCNGRNVVIIEQLLLMAYMLFVLCFRVIYEISHSFRKTWLSKTGSPKSRIDNCKFKESVIEEYTYKTFEVTPGNDKKRKKKQTASSSKLS